MKRVYILIGLILFFFPISVFAHEGIEDYYIETTITEDGHMHVKELFVLNGEFNGYERIINYKNPSAPKFDGTKSSFEGSDIYNATGIEILKVKDIDITKGYTFNSINASGHEFKKTYSARKGDYGVYTVETRSNGYSILIYNPSNGSRKAFYIEYLVKNVVINHLDVNEVGWNIFSEEQNEYINNLEMIVNIPGNKTELRAWAHGPLHGEVDPIEKDKIKVKVTKLAPNTPIDIRFIFDKDLVKTLKNTNVRALNYILEIEKQLADEANALREKEQQKLKREKLIGNILTSLNISWLVGLIILIIYVYKNYDKEHQSSFKTKYFRDFPADYGPEIVGYLVNKKITGSDVSNSILNLINKKAISYEEIKKRNFIFKCDVDTTINRSDLTESEKILIKWLFKKIGNGTEVKLNEIKKEAKRNHSLFLGQYEKWKNEVLVEANSYNFFEDNSTIKTYSILYSILGIVLFIFSINYPVNPIFEIILVLAVIISIIYFALITKRTKHGNEDYQKWLGLKRFLKDFGNFKARDLPQIALWEKYLVYASVFGIAKKLSDKMKLKINEISNNNLNDIGFDIYYLNIAARLNYALSSTITSAYKDAVNSNIAHTRASSGGGFGGGFSGGGGSFGGGGGGGRF